MSRQRFIYPEILTSEDFTTLSHGARLLFIGLIASADDYGRGRGSARAMKSTIFPADDCTPAQVQKWADEVTSRRLVMWYQVENDVFFRITKWDKYQRPKYRAASRIPAESMVCPIPGQSGPEHGTNRATGSNRVEEKRREEKREIKTSSSPKPQRPLGDADAIGFQHFWDIYPRKVGKGAARKAWLKLKPVRPPLSAVLEAVAAAKRSEQWTKDAGQFIPHPATWLNQHRWEDEPPEPLRQVNSATDSWGRPIGYAE